MFRTRLLATAWCVLLTLAASAQGVELGFNFTAQISIVAASRDLGAGRNDLRHPPPGFQHVVGALRV